MVLCSLHTFKWDYKEKSNILQVGQIYFYVSVWRDNLQNDHLEVCNWLLREHLNKHIVI